MHYLTLASDVTALTSTYSSTDHNEIITNMLIIRCSILNAVKLFSEHALQLHFEPRGALQDASRSCCCTSQQHRVHCVTVWEICNIIVISEAHNHFTNELLALPLPLSFPFLSSFYHRAWRQSSLLLPDCKWVRDGALTRRHAQTISWNPPWLSGPVDHESRKGLSQKKTAWWWNILKAAIYFLFFFHIYFLFLHFARKKKIKSKFRQSGNWGKRVLPRGVLKT